jgi:hypothetical protein
MIPEMIRLSDDNICFPTTVPRAWREEFDGLKSYKPIAYSKPPAQPPFPKCWDESPERSKHARKAAQGTQGSALAGAERVCLINPKETVVALACRNRGRSGRS